MDQAIKQHGHSMGVVYGQAPKEFKGTILKVKDMITQDGEIEINTSRYGHLVKETEEVLPEFVRNFEGNYRRLYQNVKRLTDDLNSVANTIRDIQRCLADIGHAHSQLINSGIGSTALEHRSQAAFQVHQQIEEINSRAATCESLLNHSLFKIWGDSFESQAKVVTEQLAKPLFNHALTGDQVALHFREKIEQMKEDISKKEKALNEKKEKLLQQALSVKEPSALAQLWELNLQEVLVTPENMTSIIRDKGKAMQMMLPKETAALVDSKDYFSVLVSSFRKEVFRLSDFALAEIVELLGNQGGADAMIKSHHEQA